MNICAGTVLHWQPQPQNGDVLFNFTPSNYLSHFTFPTLLTPPKGLEDPGPCGYNL